MGCNDRIADLFIGGSSQGEAVRVFVFVCMRHASLEKTDGRSRGGGTTPNVARQKRHLRGKLSAPSRRPPACVYVRVLWPGGALLPDILRYM